MESNRSLLDEYRDTPRSANNGWEKAGPETKSSPKSKRPWPNQALLWSLLANFILIICLSSPSIKIPSSCNCEATHETEHLMPQTSHSNDTISEFAGLQRNIPRQWTSNTAETQEEWDEIWDSTQIYPGIVALPDAYARGKGLPRSQRWPWDPVKGVYVINGYHNMHCVMNIKQYLEESRAGLPLSVEWGHVRHCLLVLRDEIMCNADDTPRYTGFQAWGETAYGQVRMCRDWNQLQEWALQPEFEGCWRPVPGILGDRRNDTSNHLLERYRFCSDLNPYKEKAETMWRDASQWEE